jgi:hypothetical protein
MNYVEDPKEKIALIRERFGGLIGEKIQGYELAQIWIESESDWFNWMDVPLFLTVGDQTLSISWTKFDELAIEPGRVLPFPLGGSTIRWLCEGVETLDQVIGKRIISVFLGRGDMTIGKKEIEIWTELLLSLDDGMTLDVYNALDENGIELITEDKIGEAIKCT